MLGQVKINEAVRNTVQLTLVYKLTNVSLCKYDLHYRNISALEFASLCSSR